MNREELDLSIVIPAFKESIKIERDIRAAHAFIIERSLRAEIIVVDDGSPDDTAYRAHTMLNEIPELRVFSYTPNRGKGHALKFGIMRATGRNILFADAGLCVPYDIGMLGIQMLDLKMCDLAHGSRRMRGSVRVAQPILRRIGSRLFATLVKSFIGIPRYVSDTQCGFKLYRREVAHKLYGEMFSDGFMFDIEIILRARKAKLTILEFPVLWSNDPDSRYDPLRGGALSTLKQLWGIRLRLSGLTRGAPKSAVHERLVSASYAISPVS